MLILTGYCENEILSLRRRDVGLDAREPRLRRPEVRSAFASGGAAAQGAVWIVRERVEHSWQKTRHHLKKLGGAWRRLRARADLAGVCLPDLRHSFASSALALGEPLPMIAKLLGHRRIESTARYAHVARGAVREAVERIADSLAKAILQGDGA